jgi:transcriptional regulator with XRE-family HTH domain
MTKQEIGAALKAARGEAGLSQSAVAKRTGYSPGTIGHIETGEHVSKEAVRRVANVLNVPIIDADLEGLVDGHGPYIRRQPRRRRNVPVEAAPEAESKPAQPAPPPARANLSSAVAGNDAFLVQTPEQLWAEVARRGIANYRIIPAAGPNDRPSAIVLIPIP